MAERSTQSPSPERGRARASFAASATAFESVRFRFDGELYELIWPFQRIDPRLAFGLLVAAFALAILWPKRRPLRVWLIFMTAVRALLVLGLLVAAAQLARIQPVRDLGSVLVAIDRSASVAKEAAEPVMARIEAAVKGRASRVIAADFGGRRDRLESNPGEAWPRLLLGPEAARKGTPTILLSDGHDLKAGAIAPSAFPGPLRGALLGGQKERLLRFDRMRLEEGEDQQYSVVAEGYAYDNGPVDVVLRRGSVVLSESTVSFAAGPFEWRSEPTSLPAGSHELVLSLARGQERVQRALWHRLDRPLEVALIGSLDGFAAKALELQGIDYRAQSLEEFARAVGENKAPDVLLLEGLAPRALAREDLLAALKEHLSLGGGLVTIPGDDRMSLYDQEAEAFLALLPLKGLEPPPEKVAEPIAPPPAVPTPENSGGAPVDPQAFSEETRNVKTLGLVILLDASASMRGLRLTIAKRAAVAAADALHPKDTIGIVAFNGAATPILNLSPAGDRELVKERISRIDAEGPTDFIPALEAGIDMLAFSSCAIRHVILISDGEPKPGALRPVVNRMREYGITLSTVGCGPGFDANIMSNLAAWGAGKFHAAFDPMELPQLFVIEAERLIEATGARRPEKRDPKQKDPEREPKAETEQKPEEEEDLPLIPLGTLWPTVWTRDLDFSAPPTVHRVHPTQWRENAWPALVLANDQPFAAHARVLGGRVVSFAAPLNGAMVRPLETWEDRAVLLAQTVRFVGLEKGVQSFAAEVRVDLRSASVEIFSRAARALPEPFGLELVAADGRPLNAAIERLGERQFRIRLHESEPEVLGFLRARGPDGLSEIDAQPLHFAAPREFAARGEDPGGLSRAVQRLGGLVSALPERGLEVPMQVREQRRTPKNALWLIVLWLFLLDFGLHLVLPARRRHLMRRPAKERPSREETLRKKES